MNMLEYRQYVDIAWRSIRKGQAVGLAALAVACGSGESNGQGAPVRDDGLRPCCNVSAEYKFPDGRVETFEYMACSPTAQTIPCEELCEERRLSGATGQYVTLISGTCSGEYFGVFDPIAP